MSGRRPEDRLRDANPALVEDTPPASSPQGRALFQRIIGSPVRPDRSQRRRRYALVLVPVALAAGLAAGYAWFREAPKPLLVVCFDRVSLQAGQAAVPATPGDPTSSCVPLWRQGGQFAGSSQGFVPPLTACVLPTGAVGIFPASGGQDPCSMLGLAHVDVGGSGESASIVRVQDALVAAFLARCVGESEAADLARQEMDRNGLSSWRVVVQPGFNPATPCASLAVEEPDRTVLIVPVRNSGSP